MRKITIKFQCGKKKKKRPLAYAKYHTYDVLNLNFSICYLRWWNVANEDGDDDDDERPRIIVNGGRIPYHAYQTKHISMEHTSKCISFAHWTLFDKIQTVKCLKQNTMLSWIIEKTDGTKPKEKHTQKKVIVKSMKLQNGYHITTTHTLFVFRKICTILALIIDHWFAHMLTNKMHRVFHAHLLSHKWTEQKNGKERTNFQFPVYSMNFSCRDEESSLTVSVCAHDVRTYCVHWWWFMSYLSTFIQIMICGHNELIYVLHCRWITKTWL